MFFEYVNRIIKVCIHMDLFLPLLIARIEKGFHSKLLDPFQPSRFESVSVVPNLTGCL